MSYILYFVLCLIYILIFVILHIIHFRILRPNSLFIAAIFDNILAGIILVVAFKNLVGFELFAVCSSSFLLIVIYILMGLLMAERSLTVYLLLKIDPKEGIKLNEIENKTDEEYIGENHMVRKRLKEQNASGSIVFKGDKIFLTKKGLVLINLYTTLRKVLKINQKF